MSNALTADQARAVLAALDRICARAEADMLAGGPITGAHYRAIEAERRELRTARGGVD